MTMTAEEQTSEGQHNIPMEGEDITPKKDGGVLKVNNSVYVFLFSFELGSVVLILLAALLALPTLAVLSPSLSIIQLMHAYQNPITVSIWGL